MLAESAIKITGAAQQNPRIADWHRPWTSSDQPGSSSMIRSLPEDPGGGILIPCGALGEGELFLLGAGILQFPAGPRVRVSSVEHTPVFRALFFPGICSFCRDPGGVFAVKSGVFGL